MQQQSLDATNVLASWDALKHLDSQWIVSTRDLGSTGSLIEAPAGGGAAWLWSSPALCTSSQVDILLGFGEDMEPTAVWTSGQACFVSFLHFPISLGSGWIVKIHSTCRLLA